MTDEFIQQVFLGVGIVTCIASGVVLLLFWAVS